MRHNDLILRSGHAILKPGLKVVKLSTLFQHVSRYGRAAREITIETYSVISLVICILIRFRDVHIWNGCLNLLCIESRGALHELLIIWWLGLERAEVQRRRGATSLVLKFVCKQMWGFVIYIRHLGWIKRWGIDSIQIFLWLIYLRLQSICFLLISMRINIRCGCLSL